MLPINTITSSMLDSVLIYLAVIGMLLFAATVLRLTIPVFKKFYMPASLLAGLIGLLLGPHFIGLIPAEMTSMFSSLAGRLIVLVYAPLLMRKTTTSKSELVRQVGARTCYGYFICLSQYAIPILLTVTILMPIWGVHPLFATTVEQGWLGGHGTAGGMAVVFEELNWLDGQSLSVTSATIGLIFGIFGGTALINIGVRKGWTGYLTQAVSNEATTDPEIYSSDTAQVGAKQVTSANVIDSLTFHLTLISFAVFFGWLLNYAMDAVLGFSVSWYVTAMFCGLFVKLLIKKTKYYEAIDNNTINRIQGTALDFLIVGAISAVNVPVVISYLSPLVIAQSAAAILTLVTTLWLAPRIFQRDWFEIAIQAFGSATGVAAVGLMLLRMADPQTKSSALEVDATYSPFAGWAIGGGVITSLMPATIMAYGIVPVGLACAAIVIVLLVLMRLFFWVPNGKDMSAASRLGKAKG